MKATVEEYDFHQRILARDDPVAFAALAEWLYNPLVQDVRRRAGPNADPALVEEAVGEALLDYHDHPERYIPNRASLRSYLAMAAHRDFQNAFAKELRVTGHQVSLFDPAFQVQVQEIVESQETIDSQLQEEELWQRIDEIFPDPTERRIVILILNKTRSPEPYAQVLGLCDLPYDERIREVRRVKYRITKRLRRGIAQQLDRIGGNVQ
jgi:DNA-directed RNA polymerase specialized sigma24 family protein